MNLVAKRRLYAKGRLPSGVMNRTEYAYSRYLEGRKLMGSVCGWWFERIKLKIANGRCWFEPDFMILLPDGTVELHDVKGSRSVVQEDALVKAKACATLYPFRMVFVYPVKGRPGEWREEEVGGQDAFQIGG